MESPEEEEQRKIGAVVELGVIFEVVSALEALTSREEPTLTAGLLALTLLLVVSCSSNKQ
ncbi:hypothetical protein [Salinispora oceanensis]|uniref:hypothetical protein n=1 Tax=Salinispora oceanensis TaxID=1050199 RepID=UPI0003649990|nr:hypothetical protein [Salinispora oceanensis]